VNPRASSGFKPGNLAAIYPYHLLFWISWTDQRAEQIKKSSYLYLCDDNGFINGGAYAGSIVYLIIGTK
jgi:hypothetical protein